MITQGLDVWGIEVKAARRVSEGDTIGLKRLADLCGRHFKGGLVLYNGNYTLRLGDKRFMAVPLRKLWTQ